jgi:hypothetical protein
MERKKAIVIIGTTLLALLFFSPGFTFGQIVISNPWNFSTIQELIVEIVNILSYVGMAVCPLMILIGVFNIMTSAGEPNKVKTGKNYILYAAIGLGILLLARGIIAFISYLLT